MKLFIFNNKIIVFGFTGISGGILLWPLIEVLILYQSSFPNLFWFSIIVGMTIGIVMGAIFGMSEGLFYLSMRKMVSGCIKGIAFGLSAGLIGFLVGQSFLLLIGTHFFNETPTLTDWRFLLSRSIGWSFFGSMTGIIEGIRCKSRMKICTGCASGFISGFLGGFIFEFTKANLSGFPFSRLLGLTVLGFCINIFYVFFEICFSKGVLFLLNGDSCGRYYLVSQEKMKIGGSENTDIWLKNYDAESVHAEIYLKKKSIIIVDTSNKEGTFLNDNEIDRMDLQDGTIIRIGKAQLLYRMKKRKTGDSGLK
ncbi:MAG: FHA domain-containing protein [Spirochaetales bacterium]|nr:FHA domain-containing protein [Spirochaetales bacterium]